MAVKGRLLSSLVLDICGIAMDVEVEAIAEAGIAAQSPKYMKSETSCFEMGQRCHDLSLE